MKIRNYLASCLTTAGLLLITGVTLAADSSGGPARLAEPDLALTVFALACVTILLWPVRAHAAR
jgi:hypothetical protein